MKKIKLTNKQIESIYFEDSERFIVVEQGQWVSQGKYETLTFIFKDTETETHYEGCIGRTGSYYAGYTYDSEMYLETEVLTPYEQKEVVKYEWYPVDVDTEEEDLTGEKISD